MSGPGIERTKHLSTPRHLLVLEIEQGVKRTANPLALIDQIKGQAKAERGRGLELEVQVLGEDELCF